MRANDEYIDIDIECARNHLKFYPEVWKLIMERERLEKETDVVALLGEEHTPEALLASLNIIKLDSIGKEIKRKISKIIFDIERGIPLRGVCKICEGRMTEDEG